MKDNIDAVQAVCDELRDMHSELVMYAENVRMSGVGEGEYGGVVGDIYLEVMAADGAALAVKSAALIQNTLNILADNFEVIT